MVRVIHTAASSYDAFSASFACRQCLELARQHHVRYKKLIETLGNGTVSMYRRDLNAKPCEEIETRLHLQGLYAKARLYKATATAQPTTA